jgi:hypothetical protein
MVSFTASQLFFCFSAFINVPPEFVAGVKELSLDAASNGAERSNHHPETDQDRHGWNIGNGESEAVNWGREEIYVAKE